MERDVKEEKGDVFIKKLFFSKEVMLMVREVLFFEFLLMYLFDFFDLIVEGYGKSVFFDLLLIGKYNLKEYDFMVEFDDFLDKVEVIE